MRVQGKGSLVLEESVTGGLPWLRRDHQRICALVEAITAASRHSATQFVLHRLLEDLRIAVLWHLDRLRYARARAGFPADPDEASNELLTRLVNIQAQLRRGDAIDREEVARDVLRWTDEHCAECVKKLREMANNSSRSTHWDLVHTDLNYPNSLGTSIPIDPQTSGVFMM